MLYIALHHHSKSVNCDYCGTINNHNINAQLINNGEIIKEFSFLHEPHHSGNWSGKMMDVYIQLINELGYSTQFSGNLELYSDASDFEPQKDFDFFSSLSDNTKIIPVHVTYERDFYQVEKRFEFNDVPKKFHFEISGTPYSIETDSFETFYKFILSKMINILEFNHHEFDEFIEDKLEY